VGGGIERVELTGYLAESGSNVLLNEFGSQPIGALSEKPGGDAGPPYTMTREGNTVLFTRQEPDGLTISKKFTLPLDRNDAGGYRVTLDVTFSNTGTKPLQTGSDGYYLYVGSAAPVHQRDQIQYTSLDWYAPGEKNSHIDVTWFNEHKILLLSDLTGFGIQPERDYYAAAASEIHWAAINSQFFTTIVAPRDGAAAMGVGAERLKLDRPGSGSIFAIEGLLHMPAFTQPGASGSGGPILTLQPGGHVTQSFDIYAGPKIYDVLEKLGDGQQRILNFGMFGFVSVFLLRIMNQLSHLPGSYATAIILLTLAIRGLLWPIQNKATASMRRMQQLQPRMTELKEKFKDQPERMNTEVMKLYKEYNINPLAGCLPMFIQMPIFIGFYGMLGRAIELRGSKFLWVHDLSQPDSPFHSASLSWIHVLPICMAVTMIAQMSMTPKAGDKSQQQMFLIMPLLFIFFCYNYASALALYMTVGNLFSIAQLYWTRQQTAPGPLKPQLPSRGKRRPR